MRYYTLFLIALSYFPIRVTATPPDENPFSSIVNQVIKTTKYTTFGTVAGACASYVPAATGYLASTVTGFDESIGDHTSRGTKSSMCVPPSIIYNTIGGALTGGAAGFMASFLPPTILGVAENEESSDQKNTANAELTKKPLDQKGKDNDGLAKE